MFAAYRRAKAQTACVAALRPFLLRDPWSSWPPTFWHDPYVLGFLTTVIGITTKQASNGKLEGEEAGLVLVATLKEVNGYDSGFKDRWLGMIKDRNVDLIEGIDNATKVVRYVTGHSLPANDLDLEVAREIAEGTSTSGGPIAPGDVGGALIYLLFHRIVEGRLVPKE